MSLQETLTKLQQESEAVQAALKNYLEVSKQTSETTQLLLEEEFPELLRLRDYALKLETEQNFSQRQALFSIFMRLLTSLRPEVQHTYFEILFMKRLPSPKAYPYEEETLASRIVEVYSQTQTGE